MLFWWFLVKGTLVLTGNQRGGNGESFGTFAHSVHSLHSLLFPCTSHGMAVEQGREWEGLGGQEISGHVFQAGVK